MSKRHIKDKYYSEFNINDNKSNITKSSDDIRHPIDNTTINIRKSDSNIADTSNPVANQTNIIKKRPKYSIYGNATNDEINIIMQDNI